jgi:hypothetical protein
VGTDPSEFGRNTLDLWERGIMAMMESRRGRDPKQFYDLPFERFVGDPLAAIRDIYEYFGIEYSDAADRAIRIFRDENPPGKHGDHSYSLADWELDAREIRERFRPYTEAYEMALRS